MYRPNFCSECGTKIVRLHWHPWTSRRFCDNCARRLRTERFQTPVISGLLLTSIGLFTGRAMRPKPPPLIIQRGPSSPLMKSESGPAASGVNANLPATVVEEAVYICGARTKKGMPCSRRVQHPGRCWQHKGMPAMLPAEKLVVKQ